MFRSAENVNGIGVGASLRTKHVLDCHGLDLSRCVTKKDPVHGWESFVAHQPIVDAIDGDISDGHVRGVAHQND